MPKTIKGMPIKAPRIEKVKIVPTIANIKPIVNEIMTPSKSNTNPMIDHRSSNGQNKIRNIVFLL